MVAIAQYLAFVEERETTVCFFVRQERGLVPSVMKKLVVEWRVVGELA